MCRYQATNTVRIRGNQTIANTVELGYNNIGYYDTSPIASNTQWYELIPHKATVFIPCLVRHSQMHQHRTFIIIIALLLLYNLHRFRVLSKAVAGG
jgi:hypothetical protein